MSVEVIVPFRDGCAHRERAWAALERRYAHPVTVAEGGTPWVKAVAVTPAIERSTADIVVLADADVWTDGLPAAINAVQGGEPWAIPHNFVHRLSEEGTSRYLAGHHDDTIGCLDLDRNAYKGGVYQGAIGGGALVAPRQTLLDIPMDPRFVGWGGEDLAHGIALTLLAGLPWRSREHLVHLWHPPAPRLSYSRGSPENVALFRRYQHAAEDPVAMTALLQEARHELHHHSVRAA